MRLRDRVSDQELEAVMESGRKVRPAPDVVRARLLARARAAVVAAEAAPSLFEATIVPTATHNRRIAAAAAVFLALGAAGAAAALHARAPRAPEVGPTVRRSPQAPAVRVTMPPPLPTEEPPSVSASSSKPGRPRRSISPQESYAAELQLLQRAQSQYTSQDFQDALVLIAEHAHRFPNGRLAEEREALRVRSLAGAGRGDETRRALAAFARHFPHSALLTRLRETARSAEE